jgi:hypothetical protein
MNDSTANPRFPRFAGAAPPAAFACFVLAGVAVVPLSSSRSAPLIIAGAFALFATLTTLVASVLAADRYAAPAVAAIIESDAPTAAPATVWAEFELAFRSFAARRSPQAHEKIHSLRRSGGRPPLLVLLVTDPDGRVLDAAAYDPDDYC